MAPRLTAPAVLAPTAETRAARVARMLEPRSVAVVGASARPGSFGERLATEALRGRSRVHLVSRAPEVLGHRTVPSLAEVDGDVDLVLLGVSDAALPEQLALARERGAAGAVVFGAALGFAPAVLDAVGPDPMAVCGPGCMGFVNPARGVRAIGYVERPHLTSGPLTLVTHSGSVFSALLRTHRRLEWSLAVSSGQELVTTTADYLHHALDQPETRVVALVLETMRDVDRLRSGLARATAQDVSVVALTVGRSAVGSALVAAHSGAVAGAGAAWEALLAAYGVHQVGDLDELVDTLELLALGRRVRRGTVRRSGIATVHDSGGERALVADLAADAGVPFADIAPTTRERLAAVLDPGLAPANPLDVWGRGLGTEALFVECLSALADDDAVEAVALAVDLVEEYDGDESYPRAVLRAHAATDKPVVVLTPLAAGVDQGWAGRLRAAGVPVLEGAASGLRALGHLRDAATPVLLPASVEVDRERQARWADRSAGPLTPYDLLADYGLQVARPRLAVDEQGALAAADELGYPVALKTAALAHKTDAGGVHLGIVDPGQLRRAHADLAARLGPRTLVQPMVGPGLELALGVVRDPHVGPLVVLAVGGTLVELVAERVVVLPPLDRGRAEQLLDASPVIAALLAGVRGRPPVDRDAVVTALVGLGRLAVELGDHLDALDVNPLVCDAEGAVAVDVLLLARSHPGEATSTQS